MDAPRTPRAPTIVPLRSLQEAAPWRSRIDELILASRRPSPFAALDYLEAVAEHDEHPVPGSEPLLLLARDGERLVGWLPLRRHRGAAAGRRGGRIESFLVHDTDRPGLVARPEDETRCAEAFLTWLRRSESWSELHFDQQPPDSALRPPAARRLPGLRARLWPANPNCTIEVAEASLARWFEGLPKAHRHNVARLGRRLLAAGRVDLVWSDDPAVLPDLLDAYLEVERRSWKAATAAGVGRSEARLALFRRLIEGGRSSRAVVHLLRLDGRPIAGHFGVWFGDTLHAREIAFDEGCAALAPGSMMLLLVVRAAIEAGARRVNLLSRFGYYKKEWGAEEQPTEAVQLFRVGSVAWARSWLGDLRRRLASLRPAAGGGRANAERRAVMAAAPRTPGDALQAGAPRLAEVEARLQRLDAAALQAALPFKPSAAGEVGARGAAAAAPQAGGREGQRRSPRIAPPLAAGVGPSTA